MSSFDRHPLVTIAIPNFNTGAYIEEAIASALSQSIQDFEVLIVDNASTDNSRDIIEAWQDRDERIVAHYFDDYVTSIKNWNRCLEHARGKYIVFLHADDKLKPDFLKLCLEMYSSRPDLGYVFCDAEYIDENGNILGNQGFYKESGFIPGLSEARVNLLGWHLVPVQMLIRTDCMREIGGYEYTDCLPVLLLNLGWDVGHRVESLVQYRKHQGADSSQCVRDKTLIQAIYLTKMMVVNQFLPPEAVHLQDLKPQIAEKISLTCLKLYCFDVLGHNENQLCREYMYLAKGFWDGVSETPLFQFFEKACRQRDWTPETLRGAWASVAPKVSGSAPPYSLPEGAQPFHN